KLSLKDIDSVLDVNLRGSLLTAREGAIRMTGDSASRARRRIIFISSILGTKPESGAATYNATKAGVNLLSKSLAIEWAKHGITVNTVSPGYMQTEIIDEFFEKPAGEAMINRWPAKEFMPIAALDPAVLFLLSESAQFTTGAEIIVDEGQSLT
ncbi:MAG: SDR family oxidoreductase, partial [Alphaproteobacteria bacterium]|nr:SDR family oxidoreductase [Alphaproteobacteria bacterium]